jgi:UDP-MurNAc hydroxylase
MDAIQPRYAIPFASNHCHMHEDVYGMNGYISNPLQLRAYCASAEKNDWGLKVMMPGSSWSSDSGFALRGEESFQNLERSLAQYRDDIAPTLDRYREQENAVRIGDRLVERFMAFFLADGRPSSCAGKLRLVVRWPDGRRAGYLCDIDDGPFEPATDGADPEAGVPVIEMPAIVFRDAVMKNMFHHAGISKRCRFLAADQADMARLKRITGFLGNFELGVFPTSKAYRRRLLKAYLLRWRELFVYAHALWLLKVRRKPMYLVEEAVLRGEY